MTVLASATQTPPAEGAVAIDPPQGWRNTIAFWLFVFMVAVVPLPYGSVDFFWIATWAAYSALVLLVVSYGAVTRAGAVLLWANAALALAYLAVVWLQSEVPGPAPLPIWAQASDFLGVPMPPIAASVRDGPLLYLGRPLLAAMVFASALVLGQDRRHAAIILRVVVALAAVYGLIGLLALALDISTLRPFGGSALTVFFISKNTTATYLGSALLVAFCLGAVPLISGAQRLSRRRRGRGLLAKLGTGRIFLLAAGTVLVLLLPLTESRAGLLLTVAIIAGTSAIVGRKQFFARRSSVVMLVVVLLAVFALVFVVSGDVWRSRQARVGFDTLGRMDFYRAMMESILAHPWLGIGFGSFAESFARLRPEGIGIQYFVNIGHSTPLELAYEGGLPITLLTGAFMLACAGVMLRGLQRRPSDPVIVAALTVGLLGFLHSAMDFSLQITGYMIIYLAVVGVGVGRALTVDRAEPAGVQAEGHAEEADPVEAAA